MATTPTKTARRKALVEEAETTADTVDFIEDFVDGAFSEEGRLARLVDVDFQGVTFSVSTDPLDWDFETMDHLAENRIGAALGGMVGEDEFAKFRKLKPKMRDAIEFLNLLSSKVGVGNAGN